MLATETLPKIARASSHKDVFAGLWGHNNEKKAHKLTRNKSMIYSRLELESMANKSTKSPDLLRRKRSDYQDYSLGNTVLVVVDEATRNTQKQDINQDIDFLMADAWASTNTAEDATSLLVRNAPVEDAVPPSESLEEMSPLILSCDGADEGYVCSRVPCEEEQEELGYTEEAIEHIMQRHSTPIHAKHRDYLFTDNKRSSEPILWSTTTEPTAAPLARSVSHKDWLMGEKTKAIKRLESMGYDPYKGVYVAHRARLMEEKTKAVRKMESLGYDPYKGVYSAHRGELMKEKEKVISRLLSLGLDVSGSRKH